MTADADVTATFDPANGPFVRLTTTLTGDGKGETGADNSRCQNYDPPQGSACATDYVNGSNASVRAVPAAASRFSGFTGSGDTAGCGATATCSFTLTGNAAITATFHAMTSIALAPSTVTLHPGEAQTYTANGTFSNGVTEALL
ncbi:MAG TPA: hypothetical protein VL371_10145, partial [Gemmataceae bacterium]|nr:hypothetical protein [Gemmataceae bacterium]